MEDYRQKRREERRIIRRKKSEQERREREEIEIYRSRNDAQKFIKNVKRLTEGCKPGASSCRDEKGNLVTDAQGVLRLWRHHFSTLLRGDGVNNSATREDSEPAPIDDDRIEIPPSSHNEVRFAIQRVKNNKKEGYSRVFSTRFLIAKNFFTIITYW